MARLREYTYQCDNPKCGRVTQIKSRQPSGGTEPFICHCFHSASLRIPDLEDDKYLYVTRPETYNLQKDIIDTLVNIGTSMTVRQVYYRLVSMGYEKADSTYNKVQRTLLDMRERGVVPFNLIADNSRSFYSPVVYGSLGEMLEEQQQFYRRNLWQEQPDYVEIWLEKEALREPFRQITDYFQVPLYISKGLSSVSFIHSAAENIREIGKPASIYFFSDYDPSGLILVEAIKRRMKEFKVKAHFERVCLNSDQIEEYSVATRPTKKSNHSRGFVGECAELDALHPVILQNIIRDTLAQHVDEAALTRLQDIERAERATLEKIVNNLMHAS